MLFKRQVSVILDLFFKIAALGDIDQENTSSLHSDLSSLLEEHLNWGSAVSRSEDQMSSAVLDLKRLGHKVCTLLIQFRSGDQLVATGNPTGREGQSLAGSLGRPPLPTFSTWEDDDEEAGLRCAVSLPWSLPPASVPRGEDGELKSDLRCADESREAPAVAAAAPEAEMALTRDVPSEIASGELNAERRVPMTLPPIATAEEAPSSVGCFAFLFCRKPRRRRPAAATPVARTEPSPPLTLASTSQALPSAQSFAPPPSILDGRSFSDAPCAERLVLQLPTAEVEAVSEVSQLSQNSDSTPWR